MGDPKQRNDFNGIFRQTCLKILLSSSNFFFLKVRDRIMETASALFYKQGYNSTGINQIIAEAKVAKGSFYYNFNSKEEVCIAYLNARHDYWFGKFKHHVSSKKPSQPAILAGFDFLKLMNEQENFRGCSFINILSEISSDNTTILKVIQEHKSDLRLYIKELLEDQFQADHVYLLFESAILESQLFRKQWPVEKAKTIVKSLIS